MSFLQDARDYTIFKKRVNNSQDGKNSVGLLANQFEILVHSIDSGAGHVIAVFG